MTVARLAAGEDPESLDKEPIRLALAAAGYRGDGPPPDLGTQVWSETARRYVSAYERLTGVCFVPGDYPVQDRIERVLGGIGGLR